MNVLLWLTHHIMLFLFRLQSSTIMSSCIQSPADLLTVPLWNRPLSSGEARTAMTEKFCVGFILQQQIKELAEKLVGGKRGICKGWMKMERLGKGERRRGEKQGPLNDVCSAVSLFYRLHIPLLPLYLQPLVLALSVVSVALRCQQNENWAWQLCESMDTHTHKRTHTVRGSCIELLWRRTHLC